MQNPRDAILRRLAAIDELPRLPEVVWEVERTLADSRAGAAELAVAIESDPSLAALLMKVANSAFYRAAGPPLGSISRAVARLGTREVRRLVLSIGVCHMNVNSPHHFNLRSFFQHSVAVASTARSVADLLPAREVDLDRAYLAGLLHEMGSLILDQYFDRIFSIILREAARTERPVHLVESEYLRITHEEVGGLLLEAWNLPEEIVAAVRHHHQPDRAPESMRRLCQVVRVADHLCGLAGTRGPGDQVGSALGSRIIEELGLDPHVLERLLASAESESASSRLLIELVAA